MDNSNLTFDNKIMTKATIFHNPRCSKSRSALSILQEHNVEIEEIRYLETPPTKQTLESLCSMLCLKPFELIRTGEVLFKELGLNKHDLLSDDEWLAILVDHPKLIERPIIQVGNKAVIGRPPENVLNLI